MWMHLDTPNYTYAGVAVAVADRPIGPFTVIREMQPNRTDSRDMTLFKDVDGTAWLVHSSDWNKTLRLSRLTEDFTDVDGFYASGSDQRGSGTHVPGWKILYDHLRMYRMAAKQCVICRVRSSLRSVEADR